MMKRISRMVVLVGLLLGLAVGCGQPTPGAQDPGEPEVPEDVSPPAVEVEPTMPVEDSVLPSPADGASPEASPEADS